MLRSVLLGLCLALSACQTPNPYIAASLPETAEPRDLNASAYPAPPRDYASYRTWRWQQQPAGSGDTPASEFHTAVTAELERLGLRQRPEGVQIPPRGAGGGYSAVRQRRRPAYLARPGRIIRRRCPA